ncbi:helix-turn-helix transcriptional regulator [Helcococcus bovis]|uniref:helix-turn-helix domain-containing protein n=1 Tax=Helcococcus bovis TaxID=3153252 RepID=UPI0038BAE319
MYNSFGNKLKNIRKNLSLTQKKVADAACIDIKTLRRIEKGENKIFLDYLVALSNVYKLDLIDMFNNHITFYSEEVENAINSIENAINSIENAINSIENKLSDMNFTSLNKEIQILEKNLDKTPYISQYFYLIKGIYYLRNIPRDFDNAYKFFIKSLKINNPDYNIENYDKYKYNILEFRCLKELGILKSYTDGYNKYTEIIEFCNKKILIISSTYISIKINYIIIQMRKAKYQECLKMINNLFNIDTSNLSNYYPYLYFLKYQIYEKLNEQEKANENLNNSLELCDKLNKLNTKKIILNIINNKK